jgi:transcriptional regulator with XRE-family HTH domain
MAAGSIYLIESGRRPHPSSESLEKIAGGLRVSVSALYEGEPALLGEATLPPDLDAADLEDWASGVDTLDELRPVRRALWLRWRELADYDRVVGGGERALADALEAGEKREIIERRMMELAPTPLATITERLDRPTEIHFLREPTLEERARLIAEYPDAGVVEAKRVALVY